MILNDQKCLHRMIAVCMLWWSW